MFTDECLLGKYGGICDDPQVYKILRETYRWNMERLLRRRGRVRIVPF